MEANPNTPHLTGESASTAYGVAKLLGALGTSPAAEVANLRPRIIAALVEAIQHENSQRKVVVAEIGPFGTRFEESKGKLVDHLYEALLRVAGWV